MHTYAHKDVSTYVAFNITHSFIQFINLGTLYFQLFVICIYLFMHV